MAGGSRKKMAESAASLIGRKGLNATSFSDVLAESGAPRGSIYYHFPDGKRELAQCAMRLTSDQVLGHLRSNTATTPTGVLEHFVSLFVHVVAASKATAGCAVAGVTVDLENDDDLVAVAREAFASWIDVLASQLRSAGLRRERAHGVAVTALASVEGALILSRAAGHDGPMRSVAQELLQLV